jgi:hypothetical protein
MDIFLQFSLFYDSNVRREGIGGNIRKDNLELSNHLRRDLVKRNLFNREKLNQQKSKVQ